MTDKFVIMFIVENGDLEQKVSLLLRSLVINLKEDRKKVDIVAVKPRKGDDLSKETLQLFKESNVVFYDVDLNKEWHLPFANQAYATAFVESKYKDAILLYLDSDILCLNNPLNLSLNENQKIGLAPDGFSKGNIAVEYGKKIGKHWQYLSKKLLNREVDNLNFFPVQDFVNRKKFYVYFNTGVIIERTKYGLFNKWKNAFELLIDDEELKEWAKNHTKEYHFLDQEIITLLILNEFNRNEIKILSMEFNYPFGRLPELIIKGINTNLSNITFLHYHWQFYHTLWLDCVEIDDNTRKFLLPYLPLKLYQSNIQRVTMRNLLRLIFYKTCSLYRSLRYAYES